MRTRNAIEAEISKLEAELADVKEHECARDSAVHVLKNLGWTRQYGKWVKPKPQRPDLSFKTFDSRTMTHVKEGDFVMMKAGVGDIWFVRGVEGTMCMLSRVNRITPHGTTAGMLTYPTQSYKLTVIDPKAHMGYVRNH